ncbi:hypothetical protein [Haliangium sp.]|uniref:hypothetical protein n=1 Tax=Haliangium sp. TaxID=2663208 RepID=UPI003D0A45C6
MSKDLSPLAILGGESVAEVAARLLERLPLGPKSGPAADIQGILGLVPSSDQGESAQPPGRPGAGARGRRGDGVRQLRASESTHTLGARVELWLDAALRHEGFDTCVSLDTGA